MSRSATRLLLATIVVVGAQAASAQQQEGAVFRLPPSVAATPIEIPGAGRQSATPIEIPGAGRQSATPIEIPGAGIRSRGDLVAALPVPLPGDRIEAFDPRSDPSRFAALPLPIPQPRAVQKSGRFAYAVLPDGTVYGDTPYGYTRFGSVEAYERFLSAH